MKAAVENALATKNLLFPKSGFGPYQAVRRGGPRKPDGATPLGESARDDGDAPSQTQHLTPPPRRLNDKSLGLFCTFFGITLYPRGQGVVGLCKKVKDYYPPDEYPAMPLRRIIVPYSGCAFVAARTFAPST